MEKSLVNQAILGDRLALEDVLKQHYQQLYKTAFLYVKNEAEALDIVQDAAIKIVLNIHKLKKASYFTTWAVRIVINTSLDHLRKQNRLAETELVAELADQQEEKMSATDKLDIYSGIQSLPQDLQELTVLFYFHGKKIKELSQVSGEPVGTIKFKLHQARHLLRDYLEGGTLDDA